MDADAELRRVQSDWDEFAERDPLWAVLTDSTRQNRAWDVAEFFATGRDEITRVLSRLELCGIHPDRSGEALDFGCGVGRLTAALASEFGSAVGVDISPRMIELAHELAPAGHYHYNATADLRLFADGRFAFIYSSIALQHAPPRAARAYIAEFVRILAPGGVCVFGLPEHRKLPSFRTSVAWLGRTVRARAALGTRLTEGRVRLHGSGQATRPRMEMTSIPQAEVEGILRAAGAEIVDSVWTNAADPSFGGKLRFLPAAPRHGFANRQYTAVGTVSS